MQDLNRLQSVATLAAWVLGAALFCSATSSMAAAEPTWTVDDLLLTESAGGWALSRDGRLAAWLRREVRKVDGEEVTVSNLWLSRLDDATSLAWTRGNDRASSPAFSPQGRHVAFLTNRELPADRPKAENAGEKDAAPQLWAIPVAGGEAFPITAFDRPIAAFGWIDAETLLVAAQESLSAWELGRKKVKDTSRVVEDALHEPPVRLFRVDLEGKVRRLTLNDDWIDSLSVSPDGRWAVVTAQQSLSYTFDQKVPPRTRLVEVATGREEAILEGGALLPSTVRWSPDSSSFYFTNEYSRHPQYRQATITELYRFDLARRSAAGTDAAEKVDLDGERGLGGDFVPTAGGVFALLADGVRFQPAFFERRADGWVRQNLAGTHTANLDGWEVAADGETLVYGTSSATRPPRWYVARLEGAAIRGERQLVELNEGFAGKPTGKAEILRWTGALGETVEGILHYPLDWPLDGPSDGAPEARPLMLDIHGGPSGVDRDTWSQTWGSPKLLWRQRGAFVFEVNYHGSGGYGLDWVESIAGHYYEYEIPDIEKGVDLLIERGLVDPGRMGSMGWSNGGILTAELITRTDRYKAASVGAADVEWISDWANVDFGAAFDNYYFGGPPWEQTETYIEKSPFFRLDKVTTPTLVHTGTEDRNVPPHQSWSLFRALQQLEKAPVRLLLYPGEPHGLRKIAHRRRKLEEDLAWFDRHLFAAEEPSSEALREGSPLDGLLRRASAARSGGSWGREEAGVLVPEMVAFETLEVSRFEVTRAQWAAFEPGFEVAPGGDNLPATGMSFERAQAYAAWLAEKTGRPFRLPNKAEAERLSKAGGRGGNTLDRWAGYAPNPDDAENLRELLGQLEAGALLLPVGSLPCPEQAEIFDLDGNAAEWAVGEVGEVGEGQPKKGEPVGPSADRPADPRGGSEPARAYVGLRVVVGE